MQFAAALARAGFPRESITHAVATHFDGIGMLAWRNDDGSWAPFFPNAPVLYSTRELEAMDVSPYLDARSLQPAGEHHELTSEVWLEHTGVHSPGHQIVRIESDGERALFVADLVPTSAHVPLPWIMGYDVEPLVTLETKRWVLKRAVDENWLVVFEHDASVPWGRIVSDVKGLSVQPEALDPQGQTL